MNWVGEKFNSLGPDRFNRSYICKLLRNDFKSQFPKPWKFCVSKDKGTWSSGITIKIMKAPISAVNDRGSISLEKIFKEEIYKKMYHMSNVYNYDNSDAMSDYFDRNYYVHWETYYLEIVD